MNQGNIGSSNNAIRSIGGVWALHQELLYKHNSTIWHGSFTRTGGVSPTPYSSLNTVTSSGDEVNNVVANRERICNALGIDLKKIVVLDVCHGSEVRVIDERWPGETDHLNSVDAIITKRRDCALFLGTADCNPVFFWDPHSEIIGLAHIGWRGVVANLAHKVVESMIHNGSKSPSDILVSVGPSIGPCCYKIVEPAQLSMPDWEPYLSTSEENLTSIDLWTYLEDQLIESGLLEQNIQLSRVCTACNVELFYSYWIDKPTTGRFASVIMKR